MRLPCDKYHIEIQDNDLVVDSDFLPAATDDLLRVKRCGESLNLFFQDSRLYKTIKNVEAQNYIVVGRNNFMIKDFLF